MYNSIVLFSGRVFIVPRNQRGYSWQKKHAASLLSDLELARSNSHFLGPIIVTKQTNSSFNDDRGVNTLKLTLEDGQQRITTLFLLANAVRNRFIELDGSETLESQGLGQLLFYNQGEPRLRLENENLGLHQYLQHIILNAPRPANTIKPMKNMEAVAEYFKSKLSQADRYKLLEWKNAIENKAKFVLIDLQDEGLDRYLTFDAINSRGLPLSEFDKIKNFSILIDHERNLGLDPSEKWFSALSELELMGVSSRGEETDFIADLFSTFHGLSVSQNEVHAKFVETYHALLSQADPALEADFKSFVEAWPAYANSFALIASKDKRRYYGQSGKCSHSAGQWLTRIDNMGLQTILRSVMVASHYRMKSDQDKFEKVIRACEIYLFRVHCAINRRVDYNKQNIFKLAEQIIKLNLSEKEILDKFCEWLERDAPLRDVINRLGNGEPKYNLARVTGWRYCYYFLYEYEVWCSPEGVSPLNWAVSNDEKKSTQEHILPQEHRDGGWWEQHWSENDAEKHKHRLGNLVLTRDNSVLGRRSFPDKLQHATQYCYKHRTATNSEKRIELFSPSLEWSLKDMLRRELEMLQFAAQRWGMPCCADNGSVNLPDDFHDEEISFDPNLNISEMNCYNSGEKDLEDSDDYDEKDDNL